nr:CD209 antigen-like isoform X1 [Oncorhynchus nerka]
MAEYVNKEMIELNKVTEENRKRLTRSMKTETHLSASVCSSADGRLRPYRLAAGCLGVLCVLQVTLNISLRLAFSGSNEERNQLKACYNTTSLPQDRDQSDTSSRVINLCTERDQLQKERDRCRKNMNQLERMRGQLLRERDQLQSERDQLLRERDQLLKEKDQLLKERDQLQSERDQLQTERDQLQSERDQSEKTDDKIQLQERNNALTKDRDMLRDRVSVLTNEKVALEKRLSVSELNICPKICNSCPEGWRLLGSSCYFLSTQRKTWEESRLDCMNRGADLMIINSEEERKFLCGLNKIVWIGLTDSVTGRTWKWMHGTPLTTAR